MVFLKSDDDGDISSSYEKRFHIQRFAEICPSLFVPLSRASRKILISST